MAYLYQRRYISSISTSVMATELAIRTSTADPSKAAQREKPLKLLSINSKSTTQSILTLGEMRGAKNRTNDRVRSASADRRVVFARRPCVRGVYSQFFRAHAARTS